MAAVSAEKMYEDANELIMNDQFDKAFSILTSSLEICDASNTDLLFKIYIRRSDVCMKLKRFQDAFKDAELAINLNQHDSRGYLKKGIAQFHLNDFSNALSTFEDGVKKAEAESEIKKELFAEWLDKSRQKLPKPSLKKEETVESKPTTTEAQLNNESSKNDNQKPLLPPQIKHEWYQTESHVTVSFLVKNVNAKDVTIHTEENSFIITSNDPENLKLNFNFNLSNKIVSADTSVKYLSNKIEIKLKKCEAIQWKKLEADVVVEEKKPSYPSSSKKTKNWDKLAADVEAEEKDEKLEGDGALNKLFQQVYQNGTDETRKAMNKSFSESGGTVLSTNWKDVGAKKLEVKPPDGMEWKSWDK